MSRDVWYCIPSARPAVDANTCLWQWKAAGYRVAVFRDAGAEPVDADILLTGEYHGWPKAVNALMSAVFTANPSVCWCITGGDDMDPDPTETPWAIGEQCWRHFGGTNGVMQPTGDRWMIDASGHCAAERICGSPWIGREYWANTGGKPFVELYQHFFADEELHDVTLASGKLWQRSDLTHMHHHWHRTGNQRPPHMTRAESWWAHDERIFRERKAAGFPCV